MASFEYKARDRAGKVVSGVLEANDAVELRRALRSRDLYLIQHGGTRGASQSSQGTQIFEANPSLQDMTIAMRQLATMIRAGLPIIETLQIVRSQSNKPKLQRAFADIEVAVNSGESLANGMREHPKIFNPLVIALTEAGEVAGTLDQTLEVAAVQIDREDALRRRISAAIFYPKLVIAAAVGTVAAMLLIVVPVFAQVYGQLRAELPWVTRMLIQLSDFTMKYWWVALIAGGMVYFGYRKYAETSEGRRRLDIISVSIPVLGDLIRKVAIARFVQTLAGALRGGVSVLRSLVISGQTAGNALISEAVMATTEAVRDGSTISKELERTNQFPMMVTRMIAAGESTGKVDEMLEEINRFYERDVQQAVDKFTRVIEPAMTVMVGAIVLFILLALYMPIFKLGEAFQQSNK